MKKILITRRLIRESEDKASKLFEAKFNSNDELYSQSKIAKQLLKNKVNSIESLNPDFISTGNIGCITQISHGTKVPILHTIEVLDWYTGGPKPEILK